MYVSVKGGETAIGHAHAWLAEARRGDTALPELSNAKHVADLFEIDRHSV